MEAPPLRTRTEEEFIDDLIRAVAQQLAAEVDALYMEKAFHEPPLKIVPKE